MKASLLIFVLLALVTFDAGAQKLYKFKDQQGHLHFTDEPPGNGQKPLEVRQMKAAPKQQFVWLLHAGDERHPQYFIRNDYPGPVEVEIAFTERENVQATPDLPQRFVVEPGNSGTLFTLNGIDEYAAWKMAIKYRYMIGRPLPDYQSTVAYLPPIAPNASFQITQGFGGSFSHNDAQNQYAVDIAMPVGTPVYAARAGVVLEADDDFYNGGANKAYTSEANNIRILHADGSMAIYAHLELEKAQVRPGQTVAAGQLIGYSGNTGFSTGPHLHFSVQINKGMELISVPFSFIDPAGQAEQPALHAWIKGIDPSMLNSALE
ncbi:MAG: peptidoglycan DD-metalloendopeptidase family protein [Methylobacter sp.]